MQNEDVRKIDRKALEAIRIRAVQWVEAGESPEVVIKALGFIRTVIYEWLAKYREGSLDALRSEFGVKFSEVSVGRLFKKLGLSPQRPTHQVIERDELSVFTWMGEDYPQIRKLAKEHNAEIYFGDESFVRSDYHSGTTWPHVGKHRLFNHLWPGINLT